MSPALPLMLALIIALSSACAQEVAYAYNESGGRPLESGNITEYNGSDIVTTSIAGAGASFVGSGMKFDEMKREIALKLNVPNKVVDDEAGSLVLDYPGDRTINQICSIYEHMVGKWSYKSDTRGLEVFQFSNQSLEKGEGRFSGQGDCDDFAILMASLVESVGGTSRIVLAYGPKGGHAYTEVYLGKAGSTECDVQRMLSWLRKNYKVEDINTHTDLKTYDVWLNLDWWKDPNTGRDLARHPGGPFFSETKQVPIPTREGIPPQPLMPVNEPPEVLFTISPEMPVVGLDTSFNASQSRDIGSRIEAYEWDFGDGNKTGTLSQPVTSHIYSKGGPYTVTLTLEDDEGAANSSSRDIIVNNPPQANFTIMPPNPVVRDQVKFDASESLDAEDGRRLQYHWEISNGSAIFRVVSPPKLPFDEPGMHWVNLTVTDKNGAEGYKNVLLKINQPPIPRIRFDNTSLTLGKTIEFSATASEDPDGKVVSYAWDFGDDNEIDTNKTALHVYDESGDKTIRLSIEDNEGARSDISQEIFINRPPIASFSIDPAEPKKGEPVSFNASASSDSDGMIERYLWDFGVGKAEPEVYYSEFAEHIYSRLQKYNVTLTVEDDKGTIGSFSQFVEVKNMNSKPILINLQPDIKSPQEIGSAVTWTAVAFDEESDQLEFRFSLDGVIVQDWSHNSSWNWVADQDGTHVIEAKVRDGKHDANGDSFRSAAFEIIVPPRNAAPVLTDLSPDKLSPQKAGTVISWTAKASDSEDDPLQFQFLLDGNVVQDWSESPTWSWTADQTGTQTIEVMARDAEHPEGTMPLSASFEIDSQPNKAPALISLQPDKESPQETGTAVTWTATASDAESDPIGFQFSLDGNVVQDWSESPTWSWTADQAGTHVIEAKVRDGKHDSEGDSSKVVDFEVIPLTMEGIAAGRSTPNEPPVLVDLYPEMVVAPGLAGIVKMSGPLVAGRTIFWVAETSDPENDPLQLQFSLDGQVIRDWSDGFGLSWTPTKEQVGEHVIEARVRDGNHAGPDSSDDGKSLNFVVNEPASGSGKQGYVPISAYPSDSVDMSKYNNYSYTGSTDGVVYTGSGRTASHSIINTTTINANQDYNSITNMLVGDILISENTKFSGMIDGDVTVAESVTLIMDGQISGDLILKNASIGIVNGDISGDIINNGGYLEVSGRVDGEIVRNGGHTVIKPNAMISS